MNGPHGIFDCCDDCLRVFCAGPSPLWSRSTLALHSSTTTSRDHRARLLRRACGAGGEPQLAYHRLPRTSMERMGQSNRTRCASDVGIQKVGNLESEQGPRRSVRSFSALAATAQLATFRRDSLAVAHAAASASAVFYLAAKSAFLFVTRLTRCWIICFVRGSGMHHG